MEDNNNTIEKRFSNLLNKIFIGDELVDNVSINIDSLLDVLLALFDDCCNIDSTSNPNITDFLHRYKPTVQKIRSLRLNKYDFQVLKKLAKGHFGTVSVVRNKLDNKIYAMKTLNKANILRCKELSFFMEEKAVLSLWKYSTWIPKLYSTFQDVENLYLVMEYAGGGDLFNLLDRNYPPIIKEEEAKFYIAEIILALNDLHNMGYVHRDLKPQNILIDNNGHIKLADFGSCIQMNSNGLVTSNIPVGTSDYISPEVLTAQEGNTSYGVECDWWSIGILLYELLQGDPPFSSENLMETYSQIMNHKNNLKFHGIYPISEDAKDLIIKLVCDRNVRLGKNGIEEVKQHPFFNEINWENIRNQEPPFVPTLITPDDTSNFSGYEGEDDSHSVRFSPKSNQKEFIGNNLPFIGFTYQNQNLTNLINNIEDKPIQNGNNNKNQIRQSETQTDLTSNMIDESLSHNNEFDNTTLKVDDDDKVYIQELEEKIVTLSAGLQSCQETIQNQKSINQGLMIQADTIRIQLMESEEEKNELSRLLNLLEKKVDDDDDLHISLVEENKRLSEENSHSQNEIKKLKKAIKDLNIVHEGMEEAKLSLNESREQINKNFLIMRDKNESLHYENKGLNVKISELELKLQTIKSEDNINEVNKVKAELSEANAIITKLNKELDITKETNKFLLKEIEELNENQKSKENIPNEVGIAIDNKLIKDIVANLELETKNHHILTSIYQDLQDQKGLQPTLNEVKESRDEAIQRADQMLNLNEKQANLIKTLMEKITYLEANQNNETFESNQTIQYGRETENKMAALMAENQNLKSQLAFKDQKLQEIVTKLVLAEATKPSFWPKSKEKNKERQKVLLHTIQALEQKLRLIQRENAQLRFIKQLSNNENSYDTVNTTDHFNPISPISNNSRFSTQSNNNLNLNLDTGRFTHLTIEDNKGIKVKNGPSTSIEMGNQMGTLSLNQSILTERSLSSKFGISHIK